MCDCGKPSATDAKPGQATGAETPASGKSHDHAPHLAQGAASGAVDESCSCAPTGQGHGATHAGVATHA